MWQVFFWCRVLSLHSFSYYLRISDENDIRIKKSKMLVVIGLDRILTKISQKRGTK